MHWKKVASHLTWNAPITVSPPEYIQRDLVELDLPAVIRNFIVDCNARTSSDIANCAVIAVLAKLSMSSKHVIVTAQTADTSLNCNLLLNALIIDDTQAHMNSYVHFCADKFIGDTLGREQKNKMIDGAALTLSDARRLALFNDGKEFAKRFNHIKNGAPVEKAFSNNLSIVNSSCLASALYNKSNQSMHTLTEARLTNFDLILNTRTTLRSKVSTAFNPAPSQRLEQIFTVLNSETFKASRLTLNFSCNAQLVWNDTICGKCSLQEQTLILKLASIFHLTEQISYHPDYHFKMIISEQIDASALILAISWVKAMLDNRRSIEKSLIGQHKKKSSESLERRLRDLHHPFSERDLQRKGWKHLTTKQQRQLAINGLCENNILQSVRAKTYDGVMVTRYFINPAFVPNP